MQDDDPQARGILTQRIEPGTHHLMLHVVVGAEDVHCQVVAARELVSMIGDVGQAVGRCAVAPHQHVILVDAVA